MITNPTTRGIENTFDRSAGLVWYRLHSEREDICAALLKEAARSSSEEQGTLSCELLPSRLRKIDDALDRLFSGSYGSCSRCGKQIGDLKLESDPATSSCKDCSSLAVDDDSPSGTRNDYAVLEGLMLNTLKAFDTIWVKTHNSDYRFFLLDPKTGRALVEGGRYFREPVEAMISGSNFDESIVKNEWIGIGMRVEIWFGDKLLLTSAVREIRVESYSDSELEKESSGRSYLLQGHALWG